MGESGWETPSEAAQHWYSLVSGDSIRQGDIYRDVLLPRFADSLTSDDLAEGGAPLVVTSQGTVAVLSPSCDLEQDRVETGVLVARIWPATEKVLGATKRSDYRKRLELLRQDGYASRFLLPAYDKPDEPFPWSFVEWRQPYFLPKGYLRRFHDRERLRLRHPLREKFGQWAGQRLSEVGVEEEATLDRIISIGGAGDVLEARAAHGQVPPPDEETRRGAVEAEE